MVYDHEWEVNVRAFSPCLLQLLVIFFRAMMGWDYGAPLARCADAEN
jgi:hypothetical protein